MQIWETDNQEAENKRKALIITILVNVIVVDCNLFYCGLERTDSTPWKLMEWN
jgi:hypothetical protein